MVCREVPNIDPRYDLASHNESKRAGLSPPILSSSTLSCMIGKGSMASSQKMPGVPTALKFHPPTVRAITPYSCLPSPTTVMLEFQ